MTNTRAGIIMHVIMRDLAKDSAHMIVEAIKDDPIGFAEMLRTQAQENVDYKKPVEPNECDMFTWDEFMEQVDGKSLIDYDGFAHPVSEIDGQFYEVERRQINPSGAFMHHPKPTHVAWFNR